MQSRSCRRGFTLIELLIVIAVIAVLAGLTLSSIQNAREAANRARCANNLHHIGIGYASFVDSRGGKPGHFKGDTGWMKLLKPYVQSQEQIFICEAAPPKDQPPGPVGLDLAVYSHVLDTRIQLESRTIYNTHEGNMVIPAGKRPLPEWDVASYKIEVGDYHWWPQAWEPKPGGSWLFVVASPYPDDLLIDHRYASEWFHIARMYHLFLLVNPLNDQSVEVSSVFGKVGKQGQVRGDPDRYDLVRYSTGEVFVADFMKDAPWMSTNFPHHTIPNVGLASKLLGIQPCDYGVNCKASSFSLTADSNKVLVLEYKKRVANLVGTAATEQALWPKLAAARHNGVLNVLFKDGHVQAMTQNEIDPGVYEIHQDRWLPQKLVH